MVTHLQTDIRAGYYGNYGSAEHLPAVTTCMIAVTKIVVNPGSTVIIVVATAIARSAVVCKSRNG